MTLAKRTEIKVEKQGHYIKGTRELLGFHHSFKMPSTSLKWETNIGADTDLVRNLFCASLAGKDGYKFGPYDTTHYTLLSKEIDYAVSRLKSDGPYSRQAVISFPAIHCFESIQIIIRPKRDRHIVNIIVNMRSCNVVKNFANDMFLSYMVAQEIILRAFNDALEMGTLYFNAGSLHKIL